MKTVEEKLLATCSNRDFAESAFYSVPRKGGPVEGASIRMAEAAATAMGNINFGIKTYPDDNDKDATRYTVFAIDLESNTRVERTYTRRHFKKIKGSIMQVKDPSQQYELIAADATKRLRACLLNIIPKYLIELGEKKCIHTLETAPVNKEATLESLLLSFGEFEIGRMLIEDKIGKTLEAMTNDDIVILRGTYNILKQGIKTKEELFTVPKIENKGEKNDNK